MKPIKSIEKELAACRKAFAEHPNAKLVWCCHHEVLVEKLTEPFENRISYILSNKPEAEQAVRFRNFRPVKNKAIIARPYKDYNIATAKAIEDYRAAIAKSRDDYQTATAKAIEDYRAWQLQPWEDYQTATAKAVEDYDAAIAQPREAYYAATAKAVEDYDAASAEAAKPMINFLNQEWPDHTWNGSSIF